MDPVYQTLRTGAVVAWLDGRTQIALRGTDRATFVHNLCTNDVKRLAAGKGCEAFLTNVQGKIVGHGYIFNGDQILWFDTTPGQGASLVRHLDRYLIREDVQILDESSERGELLVAGPESDRLVRGGLSVVTLEMARLEFQVVSLDGGSVEVRRVDWTGPRDLVISGPRDACNRIHARLIEQGATPAAPELIEIGRVEHGTPLFGSDITEENLPQEVDRDALAISFTKGCYLGQETVARIDALGHVNRKLRGLRFENQPLPAPGTVIELDGKPVATVTSSVYSERLQAPLAMAYVRRGFEQPGTDLGSAHVIALPLD